MEKTLKARDGVTIYYTLHHADLGQSDNLVVIGHGLTGSRFEYIHQVAAPAFTNAGYDVVRIAFYADAKDARKLDDCTVQTHADDLNDLIAHIAVDYNKVFYVGHSYGGLTALLANPDVSATAFWDSTYLPNFWQSEATYIPELDCYKLGWGVNALVSKAMFEEDSLLTHEVMYLKASQYSSPSIVLLAGKNIEVVENRELLFQDLPEPKRLFDVPGASHCFLEKGAAQLLSEKTLEWFDKYK